MSKLKVQIKSKTQMTKFKNKENVLILCLFGIHLTFGPALAGLTFELLTVLYTYFSFPR
jgi:hypothetical protein